MLDGLISGMADALGTTPEIAAFILSVAILISVGLAMSVGGINLIGVLIVLIALVGMLTVFGWLPSWLVILIILAVAAMFGTQMWKWLSGEHKG